MLIKLLDRIFAALGALLFSQVPLFIYYYMQQLQGRVAELLGQKEALIRVAAQTGKTLDQYILKFLNSSDPDFSAQGHLMQGLLERLKTLSTGLSQLQNATVWEKPFIFIKAFYWDIASSTWSQYAIGIPLSIEGGVYAFAGLLVGFGVFYLIKQIFALLWRPFRVPSSTT